MSISTRLTGIGTRIGSIVFVVLASGAVANAQSTGKFDSVLAQRASLLAGQSRIVLTATSPAALDAVSQLVQLTGGKITRRLALIDGVAATVPNSTLLTLANNASVQHLAADRAVAATMERTGATIGAAAVRQDLRLDGAGIGTAVIDSGIASWHDDLTDSAVRTTQRVSRFVDFVNGRSSPYDDYGHGTHVAGIIGGNGFDSGGARSGIAPAARLVVLKVLDGSGRGHISNVIAALDYVVAHKTELSIRIVNVSVGAGVYESFALDPLTVAAKRTVDAGIVVVAAAGNLGRGANGHAQSGGITAPGNSPAVITVGASSHMGTIDPSDDTIAAFSSRGPTAIDRIPKPDLVAPGVGIESLSAPNSSLYMSYSQYLLSGTIPTAFAPYLSLSGTSMSAPVVSGTIALMLQANPSLTPTVVKAMLQYTAHPIAGNGVLTQGAGVVNARGAVELARYFAAPLITAYPQNDSWGKRMIWGTRRARVIRTQSTVNPLMPGAVSSSALVSADQCLVDCSPELAARRAWGARCLSAKCNPISPAQPVAPTDTSVSIEPILAWVGDGAPPQTVTASAEQGDTVVWGTTGDPGDTVVWGTTGDQGDTVVWGTTGDQGDTVVWGTMGDEGDTVVWGTGDEGDTVVWGTGCGSDPSCQPVVWQGS